MVAGSQAEHAAAGQRMQRTCMVCCSKVLGIMLAVEYAGLFLLPVLQRRLGLQPGDSWFCCVLSCWNNTLSWCGLGWCDVAGFN